MTSCIDKPVSISSDPFLPYERFRKRFFTFPLDAIHTRPFSSFSSPAKMFFEEIEVDGHRMRRFEQVG